MNDVDTQQLRKLLANHFDMEEIMTLAFDLNVNLRSSSGGDKNNKIRELIQFLERTDRLDDLRNILARERPNLFPKSIQKVTSDEVVTLTFEIFESFTVSNFIYLDYFELFNFLRALSQLQKTIHKILGKEIQDIVILSITSGSLIVKLENAVESVKVLKENIIPWRKEYKGQFDETLENFQTQIRILDDTIKSLQHRIDQTNKNHKEEKAQLDYDRAKKDLELAKLKLENIRLENEIINERTRLAIEIIDTIAPNMTQQQKLTYIDELTWPIKVLTTSTLEPLIDD